ncbi:Uncharacterised protein family (UPF0270) [Klebsiella michiganensis]|uniref:Uncharacterized protein n=1 Tax=Klebsiella michiganensis TaxID=1134687 RepID=A0A7H4PGL6_9ENTR|nr:Uncharacterised protein family (UPF0270) [Klebsiella michiganensis]
MIIPWQDLDPETLDNLIESFVLREGTDYGEHERSLTDKVADVKQQLKSGEAVLGVVRTARNGEYHAPQAVSRLRRHTLSFTLGVCYGLPNIR